MQVLPGLAQCLTMKHTILLSALESTVCKLKKTHNYNRYLLFKWLPFCLAQQRERLMPSGCWKRYRSEHFPSDYRNFRLLLSKNHGNKFGGGGRWILSSCKAASSFGFSEAARGHISWGQWLSLALVARADSLTQRVKEPLLTSVADELPCLIIWAQAKEGDVCVLHLWHQEAKGRLCSLKLCSTNVYFLAHYTDKLCLWFGTATYTLCFQLAFKCFSFLINNNKRPLSMFVAFSCHSDASFCV